MFTPKNVSQLVVAKTSVQAAYDAATTAAAKRATLVNVGDYALTKSLNNVPAGSGVEYNVSNSVGLVVKTASGIKVTEQLVASTVDSFVESTITAGAAQVVEVTYPAVSAGKTYVCNVILHDHIGGIRNERVVSSYVNVDSDGKLIKQDGTAVTATLTLVNAELASLLQASLDQSNEGFVITSDATKVTITGALPTHRIGATDGLANPFEVKGGTRGLGAADAGFFSEAATVEITTAAKADDLVQLKNLEWFNSGYDKDPYRDIAWPVSFDADSNVSAAGIAIDDKVGIYQFHKDRTSVNVERQHRQLIVVGTAAGNGASAISTALTETATTA